jgi:hypothetical protein
MCKRFNFSVCQFHESERLKYVTLLNHVVKILSEGDKEKTVKL